MHIIIPMSGVGQRFIDAGYKTAKPLIEIDNKPIIEHVVNLFPGENKITFICNEEHLAATNMKSVLHNTAKNATVIGIPEHKLGPVYAVSTITDHIEDDEEVIVSYCDFGTYWNYQEFLEHSRNRNADGAIAAYKGFHPHMLGPTNYAFMREKEQWMLQIREKQPFTNNRMEEYASNGTYYFKKGYYVKKYFNRLMKRKVDLNGEFYVSLVYNLLVEDNLAVSIYAIQHMLQWGTPEDVEEYRRWSKTFRDLIKPNPTQEIQKNSVLLIPLAGKGKRFSDAGYKTPKPLIDINGEPMIVQATKSLPKCKKIKFVCLQEHIDNYSLDETLRNKYSNCDVIEIKEITGGQALTCALGLKEIEFDTPLHIAATDNGILYNRQKYYSLLKDETVDAIIWTFRNHQASKNNPEMYGWVKTKGDTATGVSVKKAISDNPLNDHAIVGAFYFRKTEFFNDALEQLINKDIRVNNEFYVDSLMNELIENGHNVKVFQVDDYIGWGTPNDYETFVYWQSFFHKVDWHPYSLEKDEFVSKKSVEYLNTKYRGFRQSYK